MAEQLVNQPPPARRPTKQSFIPQNLNHPSYIAYQLEAEGNYYISLQILYALTHFKGTTTEDPLMQAKELDMLIIHMGMELNLHKTLCHFLVAQLQDLEPNVSRKH
jgi:hypothetical protein